MQHLSRLDKTPKNPRHFVALCFLELKVNPSLRDNNDYLQKVIHVGHMALFISAYGYFWVNGLTKQVVSGEFLETLKEAKELYKKGMKKEKVS